MFSLTELLCPFLMNTFILRSVSYIHVFMCVYLCLYMYIHIYLCIYLYPIKFHSFQIMTKWGRICLNNKSEIFVKSKLEWRKNLKKVSKKAIHDRRAEKWTEEHKTNSIYNCWYNIDMWKLKISKIKCFL